MAVADMNGDGIADVVVVATGGQTTGLVSILLGEAGGRFQRVQTVGSPADGTVVVGDFTGDGRPDLVVYGGAATQDIWVIPGAGDGGYSPPLRTPLTAVGDPFMAAGDLDHDGRLDLVVDASELTSNTYDQIAVLVGHGDGGFSAPTFLDLGTYLGNPNLFQLVDLNGDGNLDLVFSTYFDGAAVVLGDGHGGFGMGTWVSPGQVAAVGDVNRDGHPDLVIMGDAAAAPDCPPNPIAVLFGNGDGTFRPSQLNSAPGAVRQTLLADVNRDGWLDLVVLVTSGAAIADAATSAVVFLGAQDGGFLVEPGAYPMGSSTGIADQVVAPYPNPVTPTEILFAESPSTGPWSIQSLAVQ